MFRKFMNRSASALSVAVLVLFAAVQAPAQSQPTVDTGKPVPAKSVQETGKLHVFSWGLNTDQDGMKLNGGKENAERFSDFWKQQNGKSGREINVLPELVDDTATADNVLGKIRKLKQIAGPSDQVVLHGSGHGGDPDGDGKWKLKAFDRLLTEDELAGEISALARRVKTVFVILDSCHSGLFKCRDPNVVVITASRADQVACFEDGGFLTTALLEGIAGQADANGDGKVTLRELYDYVSRRVAELYTRLRNDVVQNPQDYHPLDRKLILEQKQQDVTFSRTDDTTVIVVKQR